MKRYGGAFMPASIVFLWFGIPVVYVALALVYFLFSKDEEGS